tara:strand:- start:35297 stop:36235 length:939 start_codon:yes stop_codon:yes gene_type:complete
MEDFDENSLIDMDVCVLNALELFINQGIPKLNLGNFKRPLAVGSGNAAVTGEIILEDKDAIFADEGTYKQKLDSVKDIDGAILISASGGKHAPIIAKELKKRKIETRLLTCNKDAEAKAIIDQDKFFVFPKNKEPYTYNTSTYMSMILGKTKEHPQKILDFIKNKIDPIVPKDFKKYKSFYLLVPTKFDSLREMLVTKFDELFAGSNIKGRVYTPEQTKHAKNVYVPKGELFIRFDFERELKTKLTLPLPDNTKILNIPLPDNSNYAALMAISYYIVGFIQKQHKPYFKENIVEYCKLASKTFGSTIKPVVE